MGASRDCRDDERPAAERPQGATGSARRSGAREHPIATLQARDLLGPAGVVRIEHDGQIYTLRLTRNDRLILTK